MKLFKRVLCVLLSLTFVLQSLAGCSSKKTDETLYITKGEFFAYFVYEKGLTSDHYTAEDIQNCKDGSVEADIIVEWGYLPEELAKKDLKKPVQKEIVVMVCANDTFDLAKGDPTKIKDADLLHDPQLIADAYESGLFDLENGYFDGAEHMSFADCEEVVNRANKYTANFNYEANTEVTSTADGVKEQDTSNYLEGDIVVDFFGDEADSSGDAEGVSYAEQGNTASGISFLSAGKGTSPAITLENSNTSAKAARMAVGASSVKGFTANIRKDVFEIALGNPQINAPVVLKKFDMVFSSVMPYIGDEENEIMGILVDKKLVGLFYQCVFEYPDFETAATNKNIEQANGSGISLQNFVQEETEVHGWKLEFKCTNDSVKIDATKDFTVYETGRKQDWQNAKKTITATANYEISNFNLNINNLKSFASDTGRGYIKITCDTDMSFSLSQSLRYTPDDNRNGKFPSNWTNSRWTDADAKGAKEIKVARFPIMHNGVAGIEVYIYLLIAVDGSISFKTSVDGGGVRITADHGRVSVSKIGEKESELSANVNLHGRLGVEASLKIFTFIDVIKYDVGADVDIYALVNLYYGDKLSESGVCADEEGLNEYEARDNNFKYCIGVLLEFSLSGQLKESGVKRVLDMLSAGGSLDFEKELWSGGFHYEDGNFVDKCTRGDDMADALEKSKNDDVELSAYKVVLNEGTCGVVSLTAVPSETMDLMDSKNSITVKSDNNKVCKAKYNKAGKTIMIEAVGEGSTEIIITAKKGALWWKKTCEQKISVTINPASYINANGVSYVIVDPSWAASAKWM